MRYCPYFDGSTNYIYLPLNPSMLNGCTFELVTTTSIDGTQQRILFDSCNTTTAQTGVFAAYDPASNLLQWAGEKSTAGTENFNAGITSNINGQTKFMSFVWDGTTNANGVKLYQEGKLINTAKAAVAVGQSSYTICIGVNSLSRLYFWKGIIYDVRIWNYARTQQEIQRDMYKKLTGYEPGLVAYYPLDEAEGSAAYDYAVPSYTKSLIDCSGGIMVDKCKKSWSAYGTFTKALLHFENGVTDDTGKTWTAYGGAAVSTAVNKFGATSLYLDGVDDYLTTPDHADFALGNTFSVDFWFYPTATQPSYATFLTQNPNDTNLWVLDYGNDGRLRMVSDGGAERYAVNPAVPILNQWNHLYYGANSGTPYIALNGVLQTLNSTSAISFSDLSAVVTLGMRPTQSGRFVKGYIDEFRVTKGKALWTANFTPPSAPHNLLKDLVSSDQVKFSQEGYALYFDGASHIRTQLTQELILGKEDFTIDLWAYITDTSAHRALVTLSDGTGISGLLIYRESVSGNVLAYASSNNVSWDILAGLSLGDCPINTWKHFALTRQGGTFYAFNNGVLQTSLSSALSIYADPTKFYDVGVRAYNGIYCKGYISQPKIIKGKALWTANFTPPNKPSEIEWMW